MLSRVLEVEVMDEVDDAEAYDRMDHDESNRRFVDDLLAEGPVVGDLLDVGTGPAQIAVLMAQRVPDLHVWGVDLASAMLELGQANIIMAGLIDRIRLGMGDAKALHFDDGRFGTVTSNSIIHHLAEPQRAFAEAWRVTASGGRVFFRDLLRPADETTLVRLVEKYAGECDARQRQLFAESLHAALTLDEAQALVRSVGCPAETVRVTSDRHWTWAARKP